MAARDPKEEKIAAPTQKVLKDFLQNWSAYRDEKSETKNRTKNWTRSQSRMVRRFSPKVCR